MCQLLFHQFWPLFYYSFCGDSLYSEESGKAFFSTTESSQTIQGRAEAPFVSDTSAAPSLLLIKQVVPLDRRAVCSWPFPGNYPLCWWRHSVNAMMVRLQVFAAGWRKVAKSPERRREEERDWKVRNGSRQQGRQSEARSKRPCETESFLGSAPWSAAHSRKINWSGFLFLFFQPVNYLQIIEKQLFPHFPRTGADCVITHRVTTKTNIQLSLELLRQSLFGHSFACAINETNQTPGLQRQSNIY